MRRAYTKGLRIALEQWPIVIVLSLASLAAGVAFAAAAWVWLSGALDNSLATRSLLTDLSAPVFFDLLVHHRESFLMLVTGGVVMAVGFVLLGAWLNAIAVAGATGEGAFSECVMRGYQTYPAYLGLTAIVAGLYVAVISASVLLGRALLYWMAESASEMAPYVGVGTSAILGGLAVLFFATAHDHARLRVTTTDAGVLSALGWAFAFVLRDERRAVPLAGLMLATSLMTWAVYQSVAVWLPAHSAFGVTISLLWGQVLLCARMLLRVWWFAAERQLQAAAESGVGWRLTGTD